MLNFRIGTGKDIEWMRYKFPSCLLVELAELHPRGLRQLSGVIVEPLAVIPESSWQSDEIPRDRKWGNMVPLLKKKRGGGDKEDSGNCRSVHLT